MPDPTKREVAVRVRDAIDAAIWAGLTPEQIQAIVTAHLIDKDDR